MDNICTVRLKHITDIASALSMIESKKFIPAYDNPSASDAGMNLLKPEGDMFGNWIERTGVTITIVWSGPIEQSDGMTFPLASNVLYDMLPHRMFIPIGTERIMPLVKRIDIDRRTLEQYCADKCWYLPYFVKKGIERKTRYILIKRIRNALKLNNCFLRVNS